MEHFNLEELSQFEELLTRSKESEHGVVIFKHSTRCAISTMAFQRFKRGWSFGKEELPVYYLDILRHRDISNAVSEKFGVEHQSPQVLLIRDDECVYHTSHNGISPSAIESQLA